MNGVGIDQTPQNINKKKGLWLLIMVGRLFIRCVGRAVPLTLSTLGKISADDILNYFSYFSLKAGLDISCKLSSV